MSVFREPRYKKECWGTILNGFLLADKVILASILFLNYLEREQITGCRPHRRAPLRWRAVEVVVVEINPILTLSKCLSDRSHDPWTRTTCAKCLKSTDRCIRSTSSAIKSPDRAKVILFFKWSLNHRPNRCCASFPRNPLRDLEVGCLMLLVQERELNPFFLVHLLFVYSIGLHQIPPTSSRSCSVLPKVKPCYTHKSLPRHFLLPPAQENPIPAKHVWISLQQKGGKLLSLVARY